jgi:hypothetical protein
MSKTTNMFDNTLFITIVHSFADFRVAYMAGCASADALVVINHQLGFLSFSDPATITSARILKCLDYEEVPATTYI